MIQHKRYKLGRILTISVWIALSAGLLVLLVAAITKKSSDRVAGVDIQISGVEQHYFIKKADVLEILEQVHGKAVKGQTAASINLTAMETALEKDVWIKKAELFFDNKNLLQVKITEREPVARLFSTTGASFYIDSSLKRLPLSEKVTVRVPVFTGFPAGPANWKHSDSALAREVKTLAAFILHDDFWMAQIDQVDITSSGYELIPKLGNQVIRMGGINNYEQKFNNLMAFYKKVQARTGWNRYSVLDIQYKNQVVAVRRDAREIKADSLRAIEVMKSIIAENARKVNDTSRIQLPERDKENSNNIIKQSREIEPIPAAVQNNEVTSPAPAGVTTEPVQPVVNNAPAISKPPAKQPVKKKVTVPAQKRVPKAVMPSKTDY